MEPRHSENIFAKKRYTSIVARVKKQKKNTPAVRSKILSKLMFASCV